MLCYLITRILHMRNPAKTLKQSTIFMGMVSTDLRQLEDVTWVYLLTMLKSCPYIMQISSLKEEKEYKTLKLTLPKKLFVIGGSRPQHILGKNLFALLMDEAKQASRRAQRLHSAITASGDVSQRPGPLKRPR